MTPILKMSNAGGMDATLNRYSDMLAGNAAYSPSSFESIASATGTGSSGTITFNSIPSTYKHLQIRMASQVSTTNNTELRFNSDLTDTNYTYHYLRGTGAAVSGTGYSGIALQLFNSGTSSITAVSIVDVIDYASTTKNKTVKGITAREFNTTSGLIDLNSSLWLSTAAVTSISLISNQNYTTTSTFALYGIKG